MFICQIRTYKHGINLHHRGTIERRTSKGAELNNADATGEGWNKQTALQAACANLIALNAEFNGPINEIVDRISVDGGTFCDLPTENGLITIRISFQEAPIVPD